jgi:hypothetical protein
MGITARIVRNPLATGGAMRVDLSGMGIN